MPFKAILMRKLKNIIMIASSCTQFLALEREDQEPIQTWDSYRVEHWFKNNGLGACCNIIKFHNITGDKIVNASDEYLQDTLGIV